MKTTFSEATDGRRLVQARYQLQVPEADAPECVSTFEVITHIRAGRADTCVLVALSTVRVDTFEKVTLDKDQESEVQKKVAAAVDNYDPDW